MARKRKPSSFNQRSIGVGHPRFTMALRILKGILERKRIMAVQGSIEGFGL